MISDNGAQKDAWKKSPWIIGTIFVLTGAFIGLLLTVQFKSAIPSASYFYDELTAQKELIDSFLADQGLLKTQIVALRSEIDITQESAKELVQTNNLETLKTLKKEVGLEMAKGAGVEITMNDGLFVNREGADTISQSLVNASDLRDLINLLRSTKVDAISINDQRVIASSSITSVGNTILVNNYNLLPPFNIVAIGDADLIMQRLEDSASLPDLQKRVSELKIQFSAKKVAHLVTPVYNGNLSIKLIKEFTEPAL